MSPVIFQTQIGRLINRFGNKALDKEFVNLVWRDVRDMSDDGFVTFVDVMIGSRPHTKPPLLSEFREARINESKQKFKADIRGASTTLNKLAPEDMKLKLNETLSKEFGPVENIVDALEIARLRNLSREG